MVEVGNIRLRLGGEGWGEVGALAHAVALASDQSTNGVRRDFRGGDDWRHQPRGESVTVTLRFSPRFGFAPVRRALANSNAATAELAVPSHSSAVRGSTRRTRR